MSDDLRARILEVVAAHYWVRPEHLAAFCRHPVIRRAIRVAAFHCEERGLRPRTDTARALGVVPSTVRRAHHRIRVSPPQHRERIEAEAVARRLEGLTA